ncbi:MAG TPA: UbiA family prenyltransferase [Chryseosolibacter sp.]
MLSRSSWLHLRIPFSFFLLPIFLFSLSVSPNLNGPRMGWVFFILHFLLYPASNGYNSYFDKDEKSIGGLKNPPPVNTGLYYLALLFDAAAITLGYLTINLTFALMLLVYGLVSKVYSHPAIRLKKYAITGWVITGIFQGIFTFMMCYVGVNDLALENTLKPQLIFAGLLTSLMLWANYPLTQVYQHEEDAKRGDNTFSRMLGIKGTFYFAAAFFAIAMAGFVIYFQQYYQGRYTLTFLTALAPVLLFFFYWFAKVLKDRSEADYTKTMWLNIISATCLNAFFIYHFLDASQVIQAIQGGF